MTPRARIPRNLRIPKLRSRTRSLTITIPVKRGTQFSLPVQAAFARIPSREPGGPTVHLYRVPDPPTSIRAVIAKDVDLTRRGRRANAKKRGVGGAASVGEWNGNGEDGSGSGSGSGSGNGGGLLSLPPTAPPARVIPPKEPSKPAIQLYRLLGRGPRIHYQYFPERSLGEVNVAKEDIGMGGEVSAGESKVGGGGGEGRDLSKSRADLPERADGPHGRVNGERGGIGTGGEVSAGESKSGSEGGEGGEGGDLGESRAGLPGRADGPQGGVNVEDKSSGMGLGEGGGEGGGKEGEGASNSGALSFSLPSTAVSARIYPKESGRPTIHLYPLPDELPRNRLVPERPRGGVNREQGGVGMGVGVGVGVGVRVGVDERAAGGKGGEGVIKSGPLPFSLPTTAVSARIYPKEPDRPTIHLYTVPNERPHIRHQFSPERSRRGANGEGVAVGVGVGVGASKPERASDSKVAIPNPPSAQPQEAPGQRGLRIIKYTSSAMPLEQPLEQNPMIRKIRLTSVPTLEEQLERSPSARRLLRKVGTATLRLEGGGGKEKRGGVEDKEARAFWQRMPEGMSLHTCLGLVLPEDHSLRQPVDLLRKAHNRMSTKWKVPHMKLIYPFLELPDIPTDTASLHSIPPFDRIHKAISQHPPFTIHLTAAKPRFISIRPRTIFNKAPPIISLMPSPASLPHLASLQSRLRQEFTPEIEKVNALGIHMSTGVLHPTNSVYSPLKEWNGFLPIGAIKRMNLLQAVERMERGLWGAMGLIPETKYEAECFGMPWEEEEFSREVSDEEKVLRDRDGPEYAWFVDRVSVFRRAPEDGLGVRVVGEIMLRGGAGEPVRARESVGVVAPAFAMQPEPVRPVEKEPAATAEPESVPELAAIAEPKPIPQASSDSSAKASACYGD